MAKRKLLALIAASSVVFGMTGCGQVGPEGPMGPQGEPGIQGPIGPAGQDGNDGLKGDTGEAGAKGEKGDKGDTGPQGPAGETGPVGPQGPQGETGPQGEKGEPGQSGTDGQPGAKGDKGEPGQDGAKGDKGEQGLPGEKGDKGDQGPKGDQGEKGEVGPQGPQGEKGDPGQDGLDGLDGVDGADGKDGKSAYEIYIASHPGSKELYPTEEVWLDALVNGELATKEKHVVTFNTGTEEFVASQEVTHGEKIVEPTAPTKKGHTFAGWEYKGVPWVFVGYVCTEDMVLDAVWSLNSYNITIDKDNGEPVVIESYKYNATVKQENPVKLDHNFVKWIDSKGKDVTFPYVVKDHDETIKAVYTDEITIRFISNGGTEFEPIKAKINRPYETPLPVPVKQDVTFDGWYCNGQKVVGSLQVTNEDLYLSAFYRNEIHGFTYTVLESGGVRLDDYIGNEKVIEMPETILGQKVVEVRNGAFSNDTNVTSVTFSKYITTIGNDVFRGCTNLSYVDFKNVSKFGERVLTRCTGLSNLKIRNCVELLNLYDQVNDVIPTTLTIEMLMHDEDIGAPTDKLLKGITSKQFKLVLGGTSIYAYNEYLLNCETVEEVEITNPNITSVWERAFKGAKSLKKVTLHDQINTIEPSAFQDCLNLEEVIIPNTVTTIMYNAFDGCDKLRHVNLPEGLEILDFDVFNSCRSLESIKLPSTLTELRDRALAHCASLVHVTIPDGITEIPDNFITGCYELKSIIIPASVTHIGARNFYNLMNFEKIIYKGTPEQWSAITIGAENTIEGLVYDSEVTSYEYKQNDKVSYLENNLGEVEIFGLVDKTVTTVDLRDAVPGKTITRVYHQTFKGNKNVVTIHLPETITHIENSTFTDCSALKNLTIPASVTHLDRACFYNCTGIEKLVIPNTVTSIDVAAFSGCSNLKEIKLPDSLKAIPEDLFSNCSSLLDTSLPTGVTSIGSGAYENCNSLTDVVIPNTVTAIGSKAFYNCKGITSVKISNQISTLKFQIFYGCANLKDIYFYKTLTTIENQCFEECPGILNIYYEGSEQEWKNVQYGTYQDVTFGSATKHYNQTL